MRTTAKSSGWFKTLRRDRLLFAILGAAVLVLNMFQPLAAAAMDSDSGFVICTSAVANGGDDGSPVVPAGHECPLCIAGHCCTAPSPAFRAVVADPVPDLAPAVTSTGIDFGRFDRVLPGASRRISSAIRAPPFSA